MALRFFQFEEVVSFDQFPAYNPNGKMSEYMAVVVAQLVERSLPTPEVHGSNPVIGKLLYWTFICLLSTVLK